MVFERELEKQIAKLKKENAELRDNYDQFKAIAEPEIERLQKENEELKESLKKWKDAIYADVENYDDQLTKVTEIIKRLLATPRSIYGRDEDGEFTSFFNPDYEELKEQAEQFLKEIE